MSWHWLRKLGSKASPQAKKAAPLPAQANSVRLQPLDASKAPDEILAVLAKRYEVTTLEGGRVFRVVVEDAYDPAEAVVRLASALDAIDSGWERSFEWPYSERSTGQKGRASGHE